MAKKDDVKQEEAAKVEAPKLIDVQMTQAELDEYAKYAAKKKDDAVLAADPVPSETQFFNMHLGFQHNINGHKYGPGKAVVPEYLVGLLQHSEQQQVQAEVKLNTSRGFDYSISQGGQAVPVKVNT